jgi:hypothetical protein
MTPFFYTDSLGNPISVGDVVLYPVKYGSGGAENRFGLVKGLVELVEKPIPPTAMWHSTGPRSHVPHVRKDQIGREYPTEFYVPQDSKGRVRADKAYVAQLLQVDQHSNSSLEVTDRRPVTVQAKNLIVITSLLPTKLVAA